MTHWALVLWWIFLRPTFPPRFPSLLPSFPLLSLLFSSLISFLLSFFFFFTYHPAWRLEDEKLFILKCHLESSHYYTIGYMKSEHRWSSKATFNSRIQHHSKMTKILINKLRTGRRENLAVVCVMQLAIAFLLVKLTVWHLFRRSIH